MGDTHPLRTIRMVLAGVVPVGGQDCQDTLSGSTCTLGPESSCGGSSGGGLHVLRADTYFLFESVV